MADNHVKPTTEELEAKAQEVLDELEEEKEEEVGEVKEVVEEVEEEEEEKEEPEPKEDYKEKYIQSTREAQILYHKSKKINDAMDKANSIKEPTEEQLKKEYTDWDILSDFEKNMAKDSFINSQRFKAINEVTEDFKQSDSWRDDVKKFIEDPTNLTKYSSLEGKQEEFQSFANKPSRRGLDFDDLVSSFLYKADQEKPKKKKGQMFESRSKVDKTKPKSDKLSIEQGRVLRSTDYGKWKSMLKAGKISST